MRSSPKREKKSNKRDEPIDLKILEPQKKGYELVELGFPPPQVDLSHLHDNNKLLSDGQIQAVLTLALDNGLVDKNRYKKTDIDLKLKDRHLQSMSGSPIDYDITYADKQCYAIYLGKKSEKHLGEGAVGVVKLAQNIETGEWVALKILLHKKEKVQVKNTAEQKILEQAGKLKSAYVRKVSEKDKEQLEMFIPYESGMSLEKLLESKKEIPAIELIDIALSVLSDVSEIHKRDIAHLDIHKGNIMCDLVSGKTSVIDYGAAAALDGTSAAARHLEKDAFQTVFVLCDLFGLKVNVDTREIVDKEEWEKLHGISSSDPPRIQNISVRNDIKQILSAMLVESANERMTSDEAIEKFRKIRDNYLDLYSKIIKVGYIDVSEYSHASEHARKAMIAALSSVDEVRFIDNSAKMDKNLYYTIQRELAENGINVSNKLIRYTDDISLARALSEQAENDSSSRIYSRYIISSQKPNTDLSAKLLEVDVIPITVGKNVKDSFLIKRDSGLPLSVNTLDNIIISLNDEAMKPSSSPKLKLMIENTIDKLDALQNKEPIQFASVLFLLDSLEKDIQKANIKVTLFGITASLVKTGESAIATLKELSQIAGEEVKEKGMARQEAKEQLQRENSTENKGMQNR